MTVTKMMMQLQMMTILHKSFVVDISRRHYCCCHHSRSWKYYIKSWQKKTTRYRHRHENDDSSLHVMILSHGPWHHHCDSGSARRPLLMKTLSDFVVRRCGRKRSWLVGGKTGRGPRRFFPHYTSNTYMAVVMTTTMPQRLIEIFPQRSE